MKSRPDNLEQEIFIKLFESAEIARFDKDKRLNYEHEMYTAMDKYAKEEYMKDLASEEKDLEIASKMKLMGLPVAQIVEATSLTIEKIEAL